MQGQARARGLLSSQIAGIKFHWNCCILLYIAMQAYKKCSVCLGPSKVMGKIFCHMCMMKHTSQVHTWREVPMTRWVQARGHFDALWCNLQLYLNLFCVNIIFLIFYFWTFSVGSIFFWDLGSHGPVDFVGLSQWEKLILISRCYKNHCVSNSFQKWGPVIVGHAWPMSPW